jgi:HSP20 family protein
MTVVKFNGRQRPFNLVDDLFNGFPSMWKDEMASPLSTSAVPVNITETTDAYNVEVLAPGMEKSDFSINIDRDILTISAERKSEENKEDHKKILREYNYRSFKRSFTLSEKVDSEKIEAKYVNGVLTLNLPKKTEVKASTKQIPIL